MRNLILLCVVAASTPGFAKKGGGGAKSHGVAPSARAMSELAGKFKWGMSHDELVKVMSDELDAKYVELIKKETDVYKQDQLRKEKQDEIDKLKGESWVRFDGNKSGWDSSIIDKEFGHKNDESMVVIWEKNQRRFLFLWHDKLYKQYIAFDAEHPVFQGKSFDDFAKLIQNRYGQAEMKMATMRTKEDVALDHLEWPSSGDYTLWALDMSHFYGNFCLKLMQTSVYKQVEVARAQNSPQKPNRNAIIDAVTAPETVKGDSNEDVVDRITGKKPK